MVFSSPHLILPQLPTNISSQSPLLPQYTRAPTLDLLDIPLNAEEDDALYRTTSLEDGVVAEQCLDLCRPWAMLNLCGLMLMTVLVLAVFIAMPLVAYLQRAAREA